MTMLGKMGNEICYVDTGEGNSRKMGWFDC
jgi:hypothetical protein